jgi:urease accessory protein
LSARFERPEAGATGIAALEESGGYRMRFARGRSAAEPCEGAVINTGGGMAGGDLLSITVEAGGLANVVLATPTAERIYRSSGPDTTIDVGLRLEAGARLAWLPQETILFRGARLRRRLEVEMDESASLVIAETTIFGRLAMGETPGRGLFADRRRIRRNGCLVQAEETLLEGPIGRLLGRPAIGGGARAVANVLLVSPLAQDRLDAARSALAHAPCECGTSAWNGMLVARFLASDPADLRAALVRFLLAVTQEDLPRLWTCNDNVSMMEKAGRETAAGSSPDLDGAGRGRSRFEPHST